MQCKLSLCELLNIFSSHTKRNCCDRMTQLRKGQHQLHSANGKEINVVFYHMIYIRLLTGIHCDHMKLKLWCPFLPAKDKVRAHNLLLLFILFENFPLWKFSHAIVMLILDLHLYCNLRVKINQNFI